VPRLAQAFPQEIESITLGKPTLEDVFIDRTGHRFFDEEIEQEETKKPARISRS
jgi:ABC-2 type transport system ATP-binding protein